MYAADTGLEGLEQKCFISINNNTCLFALPFETLPDVAKQENKPVRGSRTHGYLDTDKWNKDYRKSKRLNARAPFLMLGCLRFRKYFLYSTKMTKIHLFLVHTNISLIFVDKFLKPQ